MGLFQPRWMHRDRAVAYSAVCRAVERKNEKLLTRIACQSPHEDCRLEAASAVADPKLLTTIALHAPGRSVKRRAVEKITDEQTLLTLALSEASAEIGDLAVAGIRSDALLVSFLQKAHGEERISWSARAAAVKQMQDEALLCETLLALDEADLVADAVEEKITRQELLARFVEKYGIYAAAEKLNDKALMRKLVRCPLPVWNQFDDAEGVLIEKLVDDQELVYDLFLHGATERIREAAIRRLTGRDRLLPLAMRESLDDCGVGRWCDIAELVEKLKDDREALLSLGNSAQNEAVRARALTLLTDGFPSQEVAALVCERAILRAREGKPSEPGTLTRMGTGELLALVRLYEERGPEQDGDESIERIVAMLPKDCPLNDGERRQLCGLVSVAKRLGSQKMLLRIKEILCANNDPAGATFALFLSCPEEKGWFSDGEYDALLDLPEDVELDFLLLFMESAGFVRNNLGGPYAVVRTAAEGIRRMHASGRAAARIERELPQTKAFRFDYDYQDSEGDIRSETDAFTETFWKKA